MEPARKLRCLSKSRPSGAAPSDLVIGTGRLGVGRYSEVCHGAILARRLGHDSRCASYLVQSVPIIKIEIRPAPSIDNVWAVLEICDSGDRHHRRPDE